MVYIKNKTILQLIIVIISLSSCKKNEKRLLASLVEIKPQVSRPEVKDTLITDLSLQNKIDSIDAYCNKIWPSKTLNGGILVAKNGQIIYEKYEGFANLKTREEMTSSTSLHLASVSKVMTATAILKLIDVNMLTLDQKVNAILPNFPYPETTIKTLLNHRSGIRNYAYITSQKGFWNTRKTLTNQDILNLYEAKKVRLDFKDDTRFSYCNTNFAILALIIEKITGLSYKDAMHVIIFKPLEMNDTFVFDYENDKTNATPSYRPNNSTYPLNYLDGIYGDKNIFSTPRDLLKFDIGRNDPSFFSPTLLEQVFTPYSNEHKGQHNYGLGMRMINWFTGQNLYFHSGWWHGNTSMYITLPKERITIIALSNKFTRKTYSIKNIAALFGDYPFQL